MEVVWKKDLNLEQIQALIKTVPLPFVAHFRIASIGGIRGDLTHPFEIDNNPTTATEGRTKKWMLFHNGHWDKWQDVMLSTAVRFGVPVPMGAWSDSRGLAWLGSIYSRGFYGLVGGQRLVSFGPGEEDIEVFGDGWKNIEQIYCSNDHFVSRFIPFGGSQTTQGTTGKESNKNTPCAFGNCMETAVWGSKYCYDHDEHTSGKVTHLTPSEKRADKETGGSSSERSPFEKRLHEAVKKSPDLVLKVAIRGFQEQKLSKNGLKRVQKAVEDVRYAKQTADQSKQQSRPGTVL